MTSTHNQQTTPPIVAQALPGSTTSTTPWTSGGPSIATTTTNSPRNSPPVVGKLYSPPNSRRTSDENTDIKPKDQNQSSMDLKTDYPPIRSGLLPPTPTAQLYDQRFVYGLPQQQQQQQQLMQQQQHQQHQHQQHQQTQQSPSLPQNPDQSFNQNHSQNLGHVSTNLSYSSAINHQPNGMTEQELVARLNEVLETSSHLYYFSKSAMERRPNLDVMHSLIRRARGTGEFLEYWYHRLVQEEQMRGYALNPVPSINGGVPLNNSTSMSGAVNSGLGPGMVANPYDMPKRDSLKDDGDGSRKAKKRGRQGSGEIIRCHQCGTHETPEWRKGPEGSRTLCNACGLFHAKLVKKKGEAEAAEILRERREQNQTRLMSVDKT
jgi:hypothetical protein